MKIKAVIVLLIIAAAAALFFSKSLRKQATDYVKPHVVSVVGTPEEKAVSTLNGMYKCMQQENLEKTLEYIYPEGREAAKKQLQKLFADHDLTYKVSNTKVLPAKDGKMQIQLELETRSTGKNKFRPRRETGVATMLHDKADVFFIAFDIKEISYL
ncbi:MAG: hypothetical protein IJW08_06415 [Lentisphaeria bacterium]|nr:hypothetical protein [Lentisphaeria bacterium]